jgi:F-box protein 9
VVHHLTREAVALHAGGAAAHLPSIVVQSALKGRWRLARAADNPTATLSEVEGDVLVETEGVGKHMYRLDLSLRSMGKGTRNNKLVWRGFHSYNRLTDDWAEFGLKNDKPFVFSRVRSYGVRGA